MGGCHKVEPFSCLCLRLKSSMMIQSALVAMHQNESMQGSKVSLPGNDGVRKWGKVNIMQRPSTIHASSLEGRNCLPSKLMIPSL